MDGFGLEPARFLAMDGRIARGVKQIVTVPNPAAGADWSVNVPGGEQWRILTGLAVLTTSAVVANRLVNVNLFVDGPQVYGTQSGTAVTASTHENFSVVASTAPVGVNSNGFAGILHIPLMMLPQGAVIQAHTFNLDVGDQWSAINLWVERYYLSDQKLDEIAELEQREYFKLWRQATAQTGA